MTTEYKRQVRRSGTAAQWASANPVLLAGEDGYETDTGDLKTGDGVTPWNSLGYSNVALEYANLAGFPGTGKPRRIYIAIDTGKVYRWNGSAYVELSPSPASTDLVPEGATNLYFTAARAIGSALTGFVSGAGTVTATDSILQAIQKIVGNLVGKASTGAIGSSGLTMSTARLLGRSTAGTGAVEEISLGTNLSLSGTTLNAAGGVSLGSATPQPLGTPAAGSSANAARDDHVHQLPLSATAYALSVPGL